MREQRKTLEERRAMLDRAVIVIERAEQQIRAGAAALDIWKEIIDVLAVGDFMENYCRREVLDAFRMRQKVWPSPDWSKLFAEIEAALGEDPASGDSEQLADRWRALRIRDSGADPDTHVALMRAWADRQYWPDEVQADVGDFQFGEISAFIKEAFGAKRRRLFGEVVPSKELDCFAPDERQRFPLLLADLYFSIEEAAGESPHSFTAQCLAMRWLELMESRTGAVPASFNMEQFLEWRCTWPPEFEQRLSRIDYKRVVTFVLRAVEYLGT